MRIQRSSCSALCCSVICFLSPAWVFAQGGAAKPAAGSTATSPAVEGAAAGQGAAPAAVDPTVEEAAQRYDRGLRLHSEGEYALAVIEFERAYELVPDYRALYNIGQVRLQLGHYARAHKALIQYLKDGAADIDDERRKAVENDLEIAASRTGMLTIEANLPGVEVFVDDTLLGQTPFAEAIMVDAGEHRLSARKSGYQPRAAQITVAGRDALTYRFDLEKAQPESQRIIVRERVQESNREAWLWGTWTATGVFAVASGVTGGLGVKAANDLEDMRGERGATRGELDSASRRARTLLLTADVFGALTILAGGAAVYVTLVDDEPEPSPATPADKKGKVALAFKPSWVGVTGTY